MCLLRKTAFVVTLFASQPCMSDTNGAIQNYFFDPSFSMKNISINKTNLWMYKVG